MKILNNLKKGIEGWLESIPQKEKWMYKFSYNSAHPYTVDSVSLGIDLQNMLRQDLSFVKVEAVNFFNSRQDQKTGFYIEKFEDELDEKKTPRVKEMAGTYLGFQVLGALKILGKDPKYSFSFYEALKDPENMKQYMDNNMPWDRSPWGAGGMVDSVATMVTSNISRGDRDYKSGLEAIFKWLDKNQDKETGLWGNPKAQG